MTATNQQIVSDHHMRVDAVSSKAKKVLKFKAFVVRDARLITGQQPYSGRKVAQILIEAMGV